MHLQLYYVSIGLLTILLTRSISSHFLTITQKVRLCIELRLQQTRYSIDRFLHSLYSVQIRSDISVYPFSSTYHGAKNLMNTVFPSVNESQLSGVREVTAPFTEAAAIARIVSESFILICYQYLVFKKILEWIYEHMDREDFASFNQASNCTLYLTQSKTKTKETNRKK